MANLNSYFISSYTNDTWTNLVTVTNKSMILCISATNTTGNSITCEIRITDNTHTEKFRLLPPTELTSYNNITNSDKIVIPAGYKINVKASAPGVTFMVNLAENI